MSFEALCRNNFPILQNGMHERPLVYLDNAATTQKPLSVISCIERYYSESNANVHRGLYQLSEYATQAYEATRTKIQSFINARESCEIIFTKGTTEAINLVAASFGERFIKEGDVILISAMEHHSNIVPWQQLCHRTGAQLRIIPVLDDGTLDLIEYQKALSHQVKLISLVHVSNVLGTINPVKQMIGWAHEYNIPVMLDGAQAASHLPIDVQHLDCDFYAFSSHKCYGPTGVGVLYGKQSWLQSMPPYQTGGDMIRVVSFDKTEYNVLPYKFEAGTPNISGVVGFGAALDYIMQIGLEPIMEHEQHLLNYATHALQSVRGLKIIGTATEKVGIISFILSSAHAHDIATILDQEGIAIRAGHHCAMPLMKRFNVTATARISFSLYNTIADVDRLMVGLDKVAGILCN